MTKKISKDREHVLNRINTSDLMVTYKILYITTEYMSDMDIQTLVEKM